MPGSAAASALWGRAKIDVQVRPFAYVLDIEASLYGERAAEILRHALRKESEGTEYRWEVTAGELIRTEKPSENRFAHIYTTTDTLFEHDAADLRNIVDSAIATAAAQAEHDERRDNDLISRFLSALERGT